MEHEMAAHLCYDLVQTKLSGQVFSFFPTPSAPLFYHDAKDITARRRI